MPDNTAWPPKAVTVEEWLRGMADQLYETGQFHLPDNRSMREAVLDDAKQAVCNDRNEEYGEPIDNFGRWAGACNALGFRVLIPDGTGAARELKPHDLAVIMGLGKLSRSVQTPDKADTWVDLAGYAAVGYELVTLEDQ